ncbi:MAG: response regulator transcription factor [Flavobacterium sp.]|nr:MAG: response regulator transcription factor [Flavobacterium sp.]
MERKTILLVEDDFLNRRLSKKTLRENNFNILEAKNAKEALEILKKETVDLAILDINLGENEQDGITLGQQIIDKFSLPFIYLTAYDNADIIGRAVSTKPYSYLTKPYKSVDLITSVEIAIRQSAHLHKYKPSIVVKDVDYSLELSLEAINYIESDGNYLLFHTDKKIYKSRSTIKQVLEMLPESTFVQVHRAYVVNKTKIEKFNLRSLIIRNIEIPVSRNFTDGISLSR